MPPYDGTNANINDILQSVSPMHVTEYDWLVQTFIVQKRLITKEDTRITGG